MIPEIAHIAVGSVAGLHASCWGAYKDSPYESFYLFRFLRSIIIGAILGLVLYIFLGINNIGVNLVIFYAFTLGFERLVTESIKIFLRVESQKKYAIPSQLQVFGKLINNRLIRILCGIGFWTMILSLFYFLKDIGPLITSPLACGMVYGAIGGVGAAIFGAWKDAPFEGFDHVKFVRSPLIGMVWGGLFSLFTNQYVVILFACGGMERATIELYKGFIRGLKSGKFKARRPIYPKWVKKRSLFIVPYIFSWIVFLSLFFL